ncbi:MAG: type III pantothenate kinase [Gammaproteobacteria bacterium]
MSDSQAALIVDLGSTQVAWRGPDGFGVAVHEGRPGEVLVARLGAPFPQRVVVGSVAAAEVTEVLCSTLRRCWNTTPELLRSTAEAGGVRNGYRDPAQLGVDRWAAVVAAFYVHGGPLLVADCGTALTLDYVDADGVHHGGLIAPGLGAMRAALVRNTRLTVQAIDGDIQDIPAFGQDTPAAVAAGCMEAVTGLLERVQARVSAAEKSPCRLFITGGDAETILAHLASPWQPMPHLVLDGLGLLAREPK